MSAAKLIGIGVAGFVIGYVFLPPLWRKPAPEGEFNVTLAGHYSDGDAEMLYAIYEFLNSNTVGVGHG